MGVYYQIDFEETGCGDVDWIDLSPNIEQWQVLGFA